MVIPEASSLSWPFLPITHVRSWGFVDIYKQFSKCGLPTPEKTASPDEWLGFSVTSTIGCLWWQFPSIFFQVVFDWRHHSVRYSPVYEVYHWGNQGLWSSKIRTRDCAVVWNERRSKAFSKPLYGSSGKLALATRTSFVLFPLSLSIF